VRHVGEGVASFQAKTGMGKPPGFASSSGFAGMKIETLL
jgi:hypothetical protein